MPAPRNLTFHPLNSNVEPPSQLNNPFDYEPHPLCQMAASEVMQYLKQNPECETDARNGKMFGVLVVGMPAENSSTQAEESIGFLAAYSGLLAGRNDRPFFVPPVFDAQQPDGHFKQTERMISAINRRIEESGESGERLRTGEPCPGMRREEIEGLMLQRKRMSEDLQRWLFEQYQMVNAWGERKNLIEIWHDYHTSPRLCKRFPLPPAGSGDCCAPKLLQYAFLHHLKPLCMAEFWYGASPKAEIRHHGHYYPACRGKCLPILTFMLGGLLPTLARRDETEGKLADGSDNNTPGTQQSFHRAALEKAVLYTDPWIAVVNKPAGMLSVPGREQQYSVFTVVRELFPEAEGPLMVHRLDMATSGLIVIAKNKEVHKRLQQLFSERKVKKRYVAVLEGIPATKSGIISLPLCPNPLDRPRQMADPTLGKHAETRYEVIGTSGTRARVNLFPLTGRTHQLRVHCAHQDGLGCPIVGDLLYGTKDHRLMLHAAELSFTHPMTGEEMDIVSEPEF